MPGRSLGAGFTLVELMVTVAVLAILVAVAVPSMADFSANNRLAAAKSAFSSTVALARTEAAKRGRPVILQAAAGGVAGNEYAGGWGLYVDVDQDGLVGAGDTQLRSYEALPKAIKISGVASLGFLPTGYLNANVNRSFKACRVSGSTAGYQITVVPSGVADVAVANDCP